MCVYVCVNIHSFLFLFQYLKAVITPECLMILDYRNLNLEQWLFRELPSQLAGEGQLVTYPLPFEFRAIEALLQYWVSLIGCIVWSECEDKLVLTISKLLSPAIAVPCKAPLGRQLHPSAL